MLDSGECDGALIALVENLQREALHYLDEAEACRRILDQHPITQEKLAASLSMSPSALANKLRLLRLPAPVRDALRRYDLTERPPLRRKPRKGARSQRRRCAMKVESILLAILVMAGVTYLIRVLPLVLIRREIKNKKSFFP